MTNHPKVSIITPVFNAEHLLDRCLSSITAQSYKNIEIIIINDGSTDNTKTICENYSQNDARVKAIHKENEGVSVARNTGLDLATGDYIYFVDADDYVLENGIEGLVNTALENSADLVVAEYYVAYMAKKEKVSPKRAKNPNDFLCSILDGANHSALWNKLFRIELFDGIRFPTDISYMEDKVLVSQLLMTHKPQIEFLDAPVYVYWQNEMSVTNANDKRMLDIFVASLYIEDYVSTMTDNDEVRQAYASFAYESLWFVLMSIDSKYLKQAIIRAKKFVKATGKYYKYNSASLKGRLLLLNLRPPVSLSLIAISSMRVALNQLSSARRERKG